MSSQPHATPVAPAREERPEPGKERSKWIPGEAGLWVFILGDMCMFAMFFGVFVYERAGQEAVFNASRDTLNTTLGAVNTLVLLTSSLAVVLGVRALRAAKADVARRFFAGAFVCGLVFSFDKYLEWSHHVHEGLTPEKNEFYMLFFVFTGIHFLHLLIGMGVLVFLWRLAGRTRGAAADMRALEGGASYWHLVDLLWVVLFPLLYLMG